MKECCKWFFKREGLQGELNIPMQFCPYCGHQLTDKEFKYYNELMRKNWERKIKKRKKEG